MKKIIFLFLSLIFTNSLALSPYIGKYALYADTKMGNLKIGTATLNLSVNDDQFIFTTDAKNVDSATNSLLTCIVASILHVLSLNLSNFALIIS